jgi:hypothetical protein
MAKNNPIDDLQELAAEAKALLDGKASAAGAPSKGNHELGSSGAPQS